MFSFKTQTNSETSKIIIQAVRYMKERPEYPSYYICEYLRLTLFCDYNACLENTRIMIPEYFESLIEDRIKY